MFVSSTGEDGCTLGSYGDIVVVMNSGLRFGEDGGAVMIAELSYG